MICRTTINHADNSHSIWHWILTGLLVFLLGATFKPFLTYDGTTTYGYDAESRLTTASQSGTTIATYAYDALGHRKSQNLSGTTTILVNDPENNPLLDYAGSGGAVQRWYVCGQNPNGLLNQVNAAAGTRATLIPDIQGSIVGSLDSSTGTLTKGGFQPFGQSSSTANSNFGYTGARIATAGLYDMRARFYSPTLGRFLQTDPIRQAGGINLYAYVNNDPLNNTDAYGLSPDSPVPAPTAGDTATALIAANSELFATEQEIIKEGREIVASPEMANIAQSYTAGESLEVNIGGRTVLYEPEFPYSGMTLQGENGFVMGPAAFQSNFEQNATVLQELFRLTFSKSASGVSGELATGETQSAFGFAQSNAGLLP